MGADPAALMHKLGHSFGRSELLTRALTHKSKVFEITAGAELTDNEQLEFLGDSILGFMASERLVEMFPTLPEGQLSKLKAHLVSANHLHGVAQRLGLGEYLILGKGEEMSGGREKRALLADAVEAVLAALYLDGGIEVARRFVTGVIVGDFHPSGDLDALPVTDYKSALQELAQVMKLTPPRYVITAETGPEHAKVFTMEVRVGKDFAAQAEGVSKKEAGQRAAEILVRQMSAVPVSSRR